MHSIFFKYAFMYIMSITDRNIHDLVETYCNKKYKKKGKKEKELPENLKDISGWDVSQVTNMNGLFFGQTKFNEPLNEWNVSNVTNMSDMFQDCKTFNQPLDQWAPKLTKVVNTENMFHGCAAFNQDLTSWGPYFIENKKLRIHEGMFEGCKKMEEKNKPTLPDNPPSPKKTRSPIRTKTLIEEMWDKEKSIDLNYDELEDTTGKQCKSNKIKPTSCKWKEDIKSQKILFHPDLNNIDCQTTATKKFQDLDLFKSCSYPELLKNKSTGGTKRKRKSKRRRGKKTKNNRSIRRRRRRSF